MGAPGAPVLQARQELRDLPRRRHLPPRAARAAHRHLSDTAGDRAGTDVTVASLNAHWGVGHFGADAGRRFDVASVVRGFDADVVVVAESWRSVDGEGLLDPLRDDGYTIESVRVMRMRPPRGPRRSHPGDGVWELSVCSRLPVLERRDLSVGRVRSDPAGERHALACTLDAGSVALELVAFHASSKLWYFGPVTHLRALLPQLPDGSGPAVVAGDFNCWGPPVVAMARGWRRAVRGRTWPAVLPHSQIDHVLVNERVEVLEGAVLGPCQSDHLPIRARLRLLA